MKLILGSSSPNRKELFDRIGLQYEVVTPDYEEVIDPDASTTDQVETFALGKGVSVYKKCVQKQARILNQVPSSADRQDDSGDFLVLGFDSMISCEGKTIGKAHTKKQAFEDIQSFIGKEQQVVTGMSVVGQWKGAYVEKVVHTSTTVRFRPDITNCQIKAYLEAGDWSGKCGSYSILGAGIFLLDSIEGDFQNIVGIPVIQMGKVIREITGKGIYSLLNFTDELKDQKKLFASWGDQKVITHLEKKVKFFREREVWMMSCGKNIGYEQNGKGETFLRPVLILRKFNKHVFWGIPLTTQKKKGPFYMDLFVDGKSGQAILSQLRLFDSKRLKYQIDSLSKEDWLEVSKKAGELLPA